MEAGVSGGGDEKADFEPSEITYVSYGGEHHLPLIMSLVDHELSEPYSIFTYRYFVYLWPQLCFLVSTSYQRNVLQNLTCVSLRAHCDNHIPYLIWIKFVASISRSMSRESLRFPTESADIALVL